MTKRTIYSILSALCLMPFTSCRTEGDTPEPYPDGWTGKSYLKIDLIMPQTTRATAGDVEEPGVDSENRIHDLTVFIYEDPEKKGVNNASTTPFVHRIYADMFRPSTDGSGVMTVNVELDKEYEHDPFHRIAVVANMGDRTALATLGALQNYIHNRTWQESYPKCPPSGCSRFTMASANNGDGDVTVGRVDPETGNTYYTASVMVERTAARIDLLYNESQIKEDADKKYIEYTATAMDGTTPTGIVRLYGLSPINVKQLPSYALKRVSENLSEDLSCFGSYHHTGEIQSAYNKRPTAYVIEPHTASKTDTQTVPAEWYAETSSDAMKATTWDADHNLATLLGDQKNIITPSVGGTDKALILTYANENTQHVSQHSDKWLTGVLLRAVFEPSMVYTNGAATESENYTPGDDFWCYRPNDNASGELYFATEEAAETYRQTHTSIGARILKFAKGHCFYHAWIKHVPDIQSSEVFPMQYGIVRNHIYRLSFVFQRAGSPEPSIEDPENVDAVIFVRPWNTFTHDQIII